jgi:sugar phosphate permease
VTQQPTNPSNVRYTVALASVLMAFLLYLDRNCIGEIVKSDLFRKDFPNKEEIGSFLSAFYFTYALFQIPAGWASDRWGARKMLTAYILGWSLMTLMTGCMTTFIGLLCARLIFGTAQAGAYPTSGGVIRRWFPLHQRGQASSWVSLGGRLGGMLAPLISTLLIYCFASWRGVLILYGTVGFAVALCYWYTVRDRPSEHPAVNLDEIREIGHAPDQDGEPFHIQETLLACATNLSLWLSSITQFCTNAGWVFLAAWLPTYLRDVQHVPDVQGALMLTMVMACGLPGMLMGGWASDQAVKRMGLRWGRIVPVSGAALIASIAYFACPWLNSVWLILICCGIVAMMTDFGNPSFWAFMQDIGGPNTSTVYGWANMWGNLGASLSALFIPRLMAFGESRGLGSMPAFLACSTFFLLAAVCVLGVDASRPIAKPKNAA